MERGAVRFSFFIISFLFILSFILPPLVHSEDVITYKAVPGDVVITVLPEFKTVFSGQPVYSEINLYNPELTKEPVDVELVYKIQDYNGTVLSVASESIAVHTQASTVRNLVVPPSAKPGQYLFAVNASYNGTTVFASDSFIVKGNFNILWLFLILGPLIILLLILYIIRERRRRRQGKREVKILEV